MPRCRGAAGARIRTDHHAVDCGRILVRQTGTCEVMQPALPIDGQHRTDGRRRHRFGALAQQLHDFRQGDAGGHGLEDILLKNAQRRLGTVDPACLDFGQVAARPPQLTHLHLDELDMVAGLSGLRAETFHAVVRYALPNFSPATSVHLRKERRDRAAVEAAARRRPIVGECGRPAVDHATLVEQRRRRLRHGLGPDDLLAFAHADIVQMKPRCSMIRARHKCLNRYQICIQIVSKAMRLR